MNFSLEKIIKLLRKNFLIIMAVALLFSAFMYYYKKNNTVPVYTAYTELYVNTVYKEDGSPSSNINAERNYVSTYIELLKTVKFSNHVYNNLSEADKKLTSPNGIYGALAIGQKNETEIIFVRVYSTNRNLAYNIAYAIESCTAEYLSSEFKVQGVEVVDYTRITGVSTVSYKRSVLIGFALGALFAFFVVFVKDLYDYRLRNSSEIKERYNLPILGTVPTFDSKATAGKSNYKYYSKYSKYKRNREK
ncbi:MAG: hypothetical protein E7597_03615 [Ruminococcaceae bacterium]|nr:hypothetical protein [Oscillospiraceae bacterium]